MIGKRYWSTGICVDYLGDWKPSWHGFLDFMDEGFAMDDPGAGRISTVGRLQTRYYVPSAGHREALTLVTDTLKADAEALGIEFRDPTIYADGDGEDPDKPLPSGWRSLLDEQAERLGWRSVYDWRQP